MAFTETCLAVKKRGITADTALRLGRYFGTSAELSINLQKRFELGTTRRVLSAELERIHPRAA